MKKMSRLFLLLPFLAVASFAQESRQDISVGVTGVFPPYIIGNAVRQTGTYGMGGLVSYRFMVTPRSALEANYQHVQNSQKYLTSFNNIRVFNRMQEASVAYVYSFTFKNFNPFIEGGGGGFFFWPIDSASTTSLDAKKQTEIGGLYGAGIAYELSPSFDIRAEYRGLVLKAPNFGLTPQKTNRYYNISDPTIGIAYHF